MIGGDGGGEAYLLVPEAGSDRYRFLAIPLEDFDLRYERDLGSTLSEFLSGLAQPRLSASSHLTGGTSGSTPAAPARSYREHDRMRVVRLGSDWLRHHWAWCLAVGFGIKLVQHLVG
jgi:hypothetical protein